VVVASMVHEVAIGRKAARRSRR